MKKENYVLFVYSFNQKISSFHYSITLQSFTKLGFSKLLEHFINLSKADHNLSYVIYKHETMNKIAYVHKGELFIY